MKKAFLGLFLATSLLISQAQAGLVIATTGAVIEGIRYGRTGQTSGLQYVAMGGILLAITGGILGVTGVIHDPVTTIVMVLDADGNIERDLLVEKLSVKFPFVQDVDVIQDLVSVIKEKAKRLAPSAQRDGGSYVTLSRAEIEDVVEPAGLSEEEVSAIFKVLK